MGEKSVTPSNAAIDAIGYFGKERVNFFSIGNLGGWAYFFRSRV